MTILSAIPNGYRKWIAFLCNLASTARHQSFSRAGLMGLAECVASAAHQVMIPVNDNEAEGDQDPFDSESSPQNDKIVLLDALRFIIESSKQHFNPNYRLRGLK